MSTPSGTVHTTTYHGDNIIVPDASHLTVYCSPGGVPAHIYLSPVDGTYIDADTKFKEVSWDVKLSEE